MGSRKVSSLGEDEIKTIQQLAQQEYDQRLAQGGDFSEVDKAILMHICVHAAMHTSKMQ